jgi:plasmid replication initiation protein
MTITESPGDMPYQPDFFDQTASPDRTMDCVTAMDVALYRVSKKDLRAGERITYELPNGRVEVAAGAYGMATAWDYDIVLMATSHLVAARDRWRKNGGPPPGRLFTPSIAAIAEFCDRGHGGGQTQDLLAALQRLQTTSVTIERTFRTKRGAVRKAFEGDGLISAYRVITGEQRQSLSVEIEIPRWIWEEVMTGRTPAVLRMHPAYFSLTSGLARYIYRLARRAAADTEAVWGFDTLHHRSGSSTTARRFRFDLRQLIERDDLPEYRLEEVTVKSGAPALRMVNRAHEARMLGVTPQDFAKNLLESGLSPEHAYADARQYARGKNR